MKRIALFALLALLVLNAALLTGALADGDTVTYEGRVTVPKDTEYVDLGKTRVSDFETFYKFLDQLPNLKKVDMFETYMWPSRCHTMTQKYPNIEFGWTIKFADHEVRTDATAFTTLHWRESEPHEGIIGEAVQYCTKLKYLDIGHNWVTDISFVEKLPDLRVLIIASNNVSDISPIASLHKLEWLEIFTNKITDISALAGLDHLQHLNIGNNQIADLSPLYGLKNLKRLWMWRATGRKVTPQEELDKLMEAIPGLEIHAVDDPTLGGWRRTDHYQVIKQINETGQYIPFSDSWPDEDE